MDANGITNVYAKEKKSAMSKHMITVENNKGRLSKAEIEKLIQEAEKYRLEDEEHMKKVESRNSEEYAYEIEEMIDNVGDKLASYDKSKIEDAVRDAFKWLDSNEPADIKDIEKKMKELENVCNPITAKRRCQRGDGLP